MKCVLTGEYPEVKAMPLSNKVLVNKCVGDDSYAYKVMYLYILDPMP